jgi:8-oxo-dGTP pyrophosphatase MutT (NUDIX family)
MSDQDGPLQFGRRIGEQAYPDRPAAFGIAMRDGKLAAVRVMRRGEQPYFDLPGGGIDPGETPQAAAVREFGEETGLIVRSGPVAGPRQPLHGQERRPARQQPLHPDGGRAGR